MTPADIQNEMNNLFNNPAVTRLSKLNSDRLNTILLSLIYKKLNNGTAIEANDVFTELGRLFSNNELNKIPDELIGIAILSLIAKSLPE